MNIVNITAENLNSIIYENKIVLLDFYVPWCEPCNWISSVIEEIAAEQENIIVGKINIATDPQLAVFFDVTVAPTIIIVKDALVANKKIGTLSKKEIENMLNC